jgi:DNA-binding transcriptional regulator YdaS (Cro superfamily)
VNALAPMHPEELRHSMRYLGLRTQRAFGERIGVHDTTVGTWLRGKVGIPRHVGMLVRMLVAEHRL